MTRAAWVLCAVAFSTPIARAEPAPELARAAFERFRGLEGKWRGKSTRGWEDESTFRTIAGGSAVLATSFDAHPGETMATIYTMNGDALELVHYCVARNAPRLRATRIEDGGRTVTFAFVDGANLPTRDKGHMDQAVYRFRDDARGQRAAGTKLSGEKLAEGGYAVSAAGVQPLPAAPYVLGGYFIVSARDDEEATRIAASHPLVRWGGRILLRRIQEL